MNDRRYVDQVPNLPTLNPSALEQIRSLPAASDDGFVKRLLELYRRQASERLEALHVAAAGDDWATVHRISHAWKTSAGQLGAERLQSLLNDLELRSRSGRPMGLERAVAGVAAEHQRLLEALED